VNPCINSQTYLETRGYKKLSFDSCIQQSNDPFAPVVKQCVNGNTQTTATVSTAPPTTKTTQHPVSTVTTTSSPGTTTAPAGSNKVLIGVVIVVVLLLVGLVVAFFVLRKNPAFMKRFGGKIPGVARIENDPYSTLGELESGSGAGFDEDVRPHLLFV
jgi:hypothetical protein